MQINEDKRIKILEERDFLGKGDIQTWQTWFELTQQKWNDLKKDTTKESLFESLNYRNKLSQQMVSDVYKVIYNGSGVHLAACVVDIHDGSPCKIYEYPTQGFVADVTTYYFETHSQAEAHFLAALLNAPCVNLAIKDFQARGKGVIGQRHVSRTPFVKYPIFEDKCLRKFGQRKRLAAS